MSSRLLAGRYELLEKIGDGGMAVVYKAKDKLLNRYIAVKILRPEFTKDAIFVENFKRESQAAAGLQHPNIVGVYDVGREGNINYIVMELVEGRTLNEIIDEQAPMDYRTVIDISKQVASALRIAHKNKIIHRDVKPHNMMVTSDGLVKLADFGIAKAVNDATLSTGSKIIGSVHYFSPEQARGNYVDERSDIYSLGIVMYEMLTGKVPFDGENPVTVALKHINEEITPPSEIVDGIPPALERCVMKATSKFQTNRFNSADELIEELNNIEFVTKVVGDSIFNKASEQVEKSKLKAIANEEKEEAVLSASDTDKYDKNKRQKTAKDKKRKIIFLIAAALLILSFVAFGIIRAGVFSTKAKVPNLRDMSYEQAKTECEKAGFKISKGTDVYSSEISEKRVVNQDPEPNEEVRKGATITVNLSKGSKEGTVPNVVGMSRDQAAKVLKQHGYVLGTVKEETSTESRGNIIKQDPSAGTTVEKETRINVIVSDGKGKEKAVVPSVTGLSLEEAKRKITNAGFSVGKITYAESDAYGKGYVMYQQYAANTELDKGSKIDLEISKGAPEPPSGGEGKNKDPGNKKE